MIRRTLFAALAAVMASLLAVGLASGGSAVATGSGHALEQVEIVETPSSSESKDLVQDDDVLAVRDEDDDVAAQVEEDADEEDDTQGATDDTSDTAIDTADTSDTGDDTIDTETDDTSDTSDTDD